MKKQLLALGTILLSTVALSGCAFGTAQSRLNSAIAGLFSANSFHVVLDLSEGGTTAGQSEQKTHFDGVVDLRDQTKIKADGTLTTQGASIEPAMTAHVVLADRVYIQFQSLNYPGSPFTITPAVQNTIYTVSNDSLGDLLPGGTVAGNTNRLSDEQKKQLKDAIRKAKPFTLVEKKGNEKVGDKRASHYVVKLNATELMNLATSIDTIEGKTTDSASKQNLQKKLDALSATPFDIWLGQFNGRLLKTTFAFTVGSTRTSGTLTFDQFNSKTTISVPGNTKPFEQLFTDLGNNVQENLGPSVDLNTTVDPEALKNLQAELDKVTR